MSELFGLSFKTAQYVIVSLVIEKKEDHMELTPERKREKQARELIHKALLEFEGADPKFPPFTEHRLSNQEYYTKLTRSGIDAGILALNLINNMAGSGGDVDLYGLLHRYLLNKDDRKRINEIVKNYG
jgi:hypothetical protein